MSQKNGIRDRLYPFHPGYSGEFFLKDEKVRDQGMVQRFWSGNIKDDYLFCRELIGIDVVPSHRRIIFTQIN